MPAVVQMVFNLQEDPVHFVEMRLKMDLGERGAVWALMKQCDNVPSGGVFVFMFLNVVFIEVSFLIICREEMQEIKGRFCLYGFSPEKRG